MAIDATVTDIVQEINDARVDMQSFADFMFKPANVMITRRLAPDTHSLQHYLDYLDAIKLVFTQDTGSVTVGDKSVKTVQQSIDDAVAIIAKSGGHVGYATLEAATADKANINAKTIVEITNDTDANNGIYLYDNTTLIKSTAPIFQDAKTYTDMKTQKLQAKIEGAHIIIESDSPPITQGEWRAQRGSKQIDGNVVKVTSNGGSRESGLIFSKPYDAGTLLVFKSRVRILSEGCTAIRLGTSHAEGGYIVHENPKVGEWIDIAGYRRVLSALREYYYILQDYGEGVSPAGKEMEVEYVSIIKPKTFFGEKVPPTDILISSLGNHTSPYILGSQFIYDYIETKPQDNTTPAQPSEGLLPDGDLLTTDKTIALYNERHPEIRPLLIKNYGISESYPYYGDRLDVDCVISREAWGMQMTMNAHKIDPTLVTNKNLTKEILSENGLVAEHGMEGFSWHVAPPNMDWNHGLWMMLKLGGQSVKSEKNSSVANKSMIQMFTPTWSERRDYREGNSWVPSSTSAIADAAIPTRIMIRQTAEYNSPEYYRISYSDTQNASWDRFSRARGTIKAPEVLQHGDSIHKQVFSVSTGQASLGEAVLDNVAEIDVRYKDDGSAERAEIVFRVWDKVKNAWVDKLVL